MSEPLRQLAERIVRDFRPEGWKSKEDELYQLLLRSMPSTASAGVLVEALREIDRLNGGADWRGTRSIARQALSASTATPASDGRLRMFLEILAASCGQADAGDYRWNWINAFCGEHEGRDPDTFNLAHQRGFTTVSHDTDTDQGMVYLTDAGRAFLATAPATNTDTPDRFGEGYRAGVEAAAGECVAYKVKCDRIAAERNTAGESMDAAVTCSLAAELLERNIRALHPATGNEA